MYRLTKCLPHPLLNLRDQASQSARESWNSALALGLALLKHQNCFEVLYLKHFQQVQVVGWREALTRAAQQRLSRRLRYGCVHVKRRGNKPLAMPRSGRARSQCLNPERYCKQPILARRSIGYGAMIVSCVPRCRVQFECPPRPERCRLCLYSVRRLIHLKARCLAGQTTSLNAPEGQGSWVDHLPWIHPMPPPQIAFEPRILYG